jgi:predicted DNA-binding protein (MmcQ/YjbR family)
MTHKEAEDYILSKPGAWLDYPFGEGVAVYKVGSKETGKMFALISEGKKPLQISLKCDPLLAEKLREEYESVMPGYHLNKTHWNTIVATGQLTDDYLLGLIDLSYRLVSESLPKAEQTKLTGRG